MIIVMLGNIGTGKGTQGKLIMKNYNIPYISTGDIFRENIKNNTELGLKVKSILNDGKLVNDELVNQIVFDKIKNLDSFVIDGYPRTIYQAEKFENFVNNLNRKLDIVFSIIVSEENIIKRLTGRRICPECGKIYNIYFDKPEKDEICNFDGEKLIQREDDKVEIVKKRIEEFKENTEPVIEYYRNKNIIYEIDGEKEIFEVFNDIKRVIDDYIKK
ncbi:MAG TPA: adenylate kinase [Caldisericia bacterium]|nr:adenylate kinase [Caldisericia bacterium]HRT37068.1 adenylate kinase [Caldisericia bacterium]